MRIPYPPVAAILVSLLLSGTAVAHPHEKGHSKASAGSANHEQRLAQLDTDGDDRISRTEFEAAEHPRFDELDQNDDGVITLSEMQAELQARMMERSQEHFQAMDQDQDGMVTLAEMQDGAFQRMDANGDGYISLQEFGSKKRHRHGPGNF